MNSDKSAGDAPQPPAQPYFDAQASAEGVIERMAGCRDERLKTVMAAVVRHLHDLVREVEPTPAEWAAAIAFLTATGQKCDATRQEYILLSDVLGVSMLVDALNHRGPSDATESTVEGPFHVAGTPARDNGFDIRLDGKGEPLLVAGRISAPDGTPIAGATLDVWQASSDGFYDVQQPGLQPAMNLRGLFRTDAEGRYRFRTAVPRFYPVPTDGPAGRLLVALGRHPYRPAHIHFMLAADGFRPLTTHIFVRGDAYLESDAVFGVKQSLIRDLVIVDDPARAAAVGLPAPFQAVTADFVLDPAP